mmetsp:Transcript_7293/g.12126  ORF Transcript_7293/g.12126 Transcript_7293/m.12126 type:complete len:425 (+) Transcript_7293:169-1443(+)
MASFGARRAAQAVAAGTGLTGGTGIFNGDSNHHVAESRAETRDEGETIIFHAEEVAQDAGPATLEQEAKSPPPARGRNSSCSGSWVVPNSDAKNVASSMGITLRPFLSRGILNVGQSLARDSRVQAAILENEALQTLLHQTAQQRLEEEGFAGLADETTPQTFTESMAEELDQASGNLENGPDDYSAARDWESGLHLAAADDAFSAYSTESFVEVGRSLLRASEAPPAPAPARAPGPAVAAAPELERCPSVCGSEATAASAASTWDEVLDRYECGICAGVMVAPHVVDCAGIGHTFCGPCVAEWMGQARAEGCETTCPYCRQAITAALPVFLVDQDIHKAVKEAEECEEKDFWKKRLLEAKRRGLETLHEEDDEDQQSNNGRRRPSDGNKVVETVLMVATVLVGVFLLRRVGSMSLSRLVRCFR